MKLKNNNMNFLFSLALLAATSCRDQSNNSGSVNYPTNPKPPTIITLTQLKTDKAAYKPGEVVNLSIDKIYPNTFVKYTYLGDVISEENLTSQTWTWTPPSADYRGYMVTVYQKNADNSITIIGTTAVDVSSDWAKFPRYGFLSNFGNVSDAEKKAVIENLNNYHINGLQFYDWHYKHHEPLAGTPQNPMETWTDIANRTTYKKTVEDYIALAHQKNMKAMFYNLNYGVLEDYDRNQITDQFFIYKDQNHTKIDKFELSAPFKSNILFVDPANTNWQNYLAKKNEDVYKVYNFDGFHIDQVGNRGKVYRYDGSNANLKNTFPSFINAMKTASPNKKLIFNAVNQFGQEEMAKTPLDFLYTEVWTPNDGYKDLAEILKNNYAYSNNTKNSVLAAYMNYDKANNREEFNLPGVLMANSVIFAFGGSHLELGEHMLGKEYFPNNNLIMTGELKTALAEYYDFLTAYQNLLRDGGTFNNVTLSSGDGKINFSQWPPSIGKVAAIGKQVNNKQVVHLINFTNANSLNWRDKDGTQNPVETVKNAMITMNYTGSVNKIWYATPDFDGGSAQSIAFTKNGDKINFKVPNLKYWGMIVVE